MTNTGTATVYGATSIGGALSATSTLTVTGLTTLTNASTTQLSITGNLWINGFATTTSSGNIQGQGILTMLGTGTSTFSGGIQSTALNITSATASSTFANGIILSKGCFLMPDGTCAGAGGGSGTINSGTTGQLSYYAGNGTTLTATSSIFLSSNQNIGIGTTTPNWLLQVAGARPFLTLSDTGAGTDNKHWFMSSQGGNFYVGTSSDAYATSTISALTILANSRVGIGTSTPFEKFAVQGGLGADYLTIAGASNSTSTFSTGGLTVGTSQFVVQQTSGNVGVGTTGPIDRMHIYKSVAQTTTSLDGNIVLSGSWETTAPSILFKLEPGGISNAFLAKISVPGGVAGPSGIAFSLEKDGWGTLTELMRLTNTGNVGIGTTTPNWLLQTAGTRPFFTLSDTSATTNNKHWFLSSQGGNFYIGTSSDAYATSTSNLLNLISSNYAVGIGTTSPTEQLSVSGRLFVGGTGTSTIQNNLYVMGTLRSTVSYVGDLIFSNNFKFIETPPNAKIQSLFLQNQYGENLFKIDEKGELIVKKIKAEEGDFKQGNFEEKLKTKELQIGSSQNRTGITIYDKKTGEPVCVFSENNVLKSSKGECE